MADVRAGVSLADLELDSLAVAELAAIVQEGVGPGERRGRGKDATLVEVAAAIDARWRPRGCRWVSGAQIAVIGLGMVTPALQGVDATWRRVRQEASIAATTDPRLAGMPVDFCASVAAPGQSDRNEGRRGALRRPAAGVSPTRAGLRTQVPENRPPRHALPSC
ncbi:hypothetical protein AMK16_26260 [Streptomyces sp. CB00455]|uniref:hypothetical protein n=1 Tax=Streptomyces sp. CB00455 TaxID=1703927 RepID=UPI00093EF2B7|nr:hypothetical protein [Streptomyces sp. CB00455]OKK16200.1 hypothetical protein AMK16_26260 [Streptomyces sp. CB00455]